MACRHAEPSDARLILKFCSVSAASRYRAKKRAAVLRPFSLRRVYSTGDESNRTRVSNPQFRMGDD